MTKSGLPQSLRKYVRLQKAKIRREVFDSQKQVEFISGLYKKISEANHKKQRDPADKQENIKSAAAEKLLSAKQ